LGLCICSFFRKVLKQQLLEPVTTAHNADEVKEAFLVAVNI
jgi:hypothetical protein